MHNLFVTRFGRANEVVVGQVQSLSKGFPGSREFVAIFLRGLLIGGRRLLHLLAVLIQAGQEKDFL